MTLLTSFLISLFLTPLMRICAIKLGIVDVPNNRKIHGAPIPLLGGVSIFLGFIISFVICMPIDHKALIIVITSFMILILGLYDDVSNLKVSWRLAIEVLVAILFIGFDIKIMVGSYITQNPTLIFMIDGMITILWVVGIINAINFIDGLDSLSVDITFWSSAGFLLVGILEKSTTIIGISLPLIGAIVGFFPYNTHPAKIFMGDAGSTFLGFILSILSIFTFNQLRHPFAISVPIIFLGVALFDMVFVVLKRMAQGKSAFVADNKHIHHRMMEKGLNQIQTLLHINCLSVGGAIVGSSIYLLKSYTAGMALVILFTIFVVKKSGIVLGGRKH